MRKLLIAFCLCVPVWAQLPNMEAKPHLVQARRSAADSLAYNQNVVSGNELIVAYECFSGGNCASGPSISDTRSSSWTSRVTQGSVQCGNLWIWTASAASSGADTITITNGGSFKNITISEFSNVTNTLDVASQAVGWSSLSTIPTPSITTTANGDLLFAAAHTCNSGAINPITPLQLVSIESTADSMATGYKISGTNGSYSASFNWPSGGSSGNAAIIALKPASALTVTTTALPDASTSAAYKANLNAEGGSGSYTWTQTVGSLPLGLSLASDGTISGTPTAGNGDASMTFQVTDGVSATATKSLTLHVGTSFNTISAVQSHTTSSLGTVTIGNVILFAASTDIGSQPLVSSSRVTWSSLPLSLAVQQIAVSYFIGVVNSTGSDTVTTTGDNVKAILSTEFSNVQQIFDEAANSLITSSGGGTYTSNSMTAPVSETLWTTATPFTSTATLTIQAPFTADTTATTSGVQVTDGYEIGAASGATTVSYSASGNTDGHWGIMLMGIRPTSSGTAANAGGPRHRAQVY